MFEHYCCVVLIIFTVPQAVARYPFLDLVVPGEEVITDSLS